MTLSEFEPGAREETSHDGHHDDARITEVLAEIVGDADTKTMFRRLLQQALQKLIDTELPRRDRGGTP